MAENPFAERLADSYRDGAVTHDDLETKSLTDSVMGAFAADLGESMEAWRGAESAFVFWAQAISTAAEELDTPNDSHGLLRMSMTLCAAFLDQPCARALRKARGE